MKIYIANPTAPRPANVVHIANVMYPHDAEKLVRNLCTISHAVYDIASDQISLITSDDPDEPFTYIIAPDDMPRADVAAHFDCVDE
jgi:hypothetical protein